MSHKRKIEELKISNPKIMKECVSIAKAEDVEISMNPVDRTINLTFAYKKDHVDDLLQYIKIANERFEINQKRDDLFKLIYSEQQKADQKRVDYHGVGDD